MGRMIDADKLIKSIESDRDCSDMPSQWIDGVNYAIDLIELYEPTIDAVSVDEWCHDCKEYDKEKHSCPRFNRVIRTALKDADMVSVVRCKDCKYWKPWHCSQFNDHTHEVDYCSYGERKDHE